MLNAHDGLRLAKKYKGHDGDGKMEFAQMVNEDEGRQIIIATAKSFLRTKYHHMGRRRGVGIDCATLILECAIAAGIVPADEQLPHYPFQWCMNGSTESLINFIKRFCPEFDGPPKPASLVVWQMGRTFSHGAIVVDWPKCIHANVQSGCEWMDAEADQRFARMGDAPRPKKFFDHWA